MRSDAERVEVGAWQMIGALFSDRPVTFVSYSEEYARRSMRRVREIMEVPDGDDG